MFGLSVIEAIGRAVSTWSWTCSLMTHGNAATMALGAVRSACAGGHCGPYTYWSAETTVSVRKEGDADSAQYAMLSDARIIARTGAEHKKAGDGYSCSRHPLGERIVDFAAHGQSLPAMLDLLVTGELPLLVDLLVGPLAVWGGGDVQPRHIGLELRKHLVGELQNNDAGLSLGDHHLLLVAAGATFILLMMTRGDRCRTAGVKGAVASRPRDHDPSPR